LDERSLPTFPKNDRSSKNQHSKKPKTLVEYIAVMKLCPEA